MTSHRSHHPSPSSRVAAMVLAIALAGCDQTGELGTGVEVVAANSYTVNEIGTGDFDGDGYADLWTANHNAGATVLRSTGDPSHPFEPLFEVAQEAAFPALRDRSDALPPAEKGALVYWHQHDLKIVTGDLEGPLEIRLELSWAGAEHEGGGEVSIKDGAPTSIVVQLDDNQDLTFRPKDGKNSAGGLVRFVTIAGDDPVWVGREGDLAKVGDTFRLRDFHSIVVSDLNGDEKADFVIYGGGMRGQVGRWAPDAREVLMLSSADGWIRAEGPRKEGCRTRIARREGEGIRVNCREADTDRFDIFADGAWTTRSVEPERIRNSFTLCDRFGLPGKARCALGDFDHDGADELVVSLPVDDWNYTVRLHEISTN